MSDYNSGNTVIEKSRRFYKNHVAPMIHERFREYEDRIAVGLAGEGSDCFGYDDLISRDHDFGTGVCLWVTDDDMDRFGFLLSIAYNELVDRFADEYITDRIRERRGVIRIHDFYSNILGIDCDTDHCTISADEWRALDHSCLATATNGSVFRDDPGSFTAFRSLLLSYYPQDIWRLRIAGELHKFSQSLQVNYARCMTRQDAVASEICRCRGVEAAMELYFLMKRIYPPYYKWTYKALTEIADDDFCQLVNDLSRLPCDPNAWITEKYHPYRLNTNDRIVVITERIAEIIADMLKDHGMTHSSDPYLERHVNEVLSDFRMSA